MTEKKYLFQGVLPILGASFFWAFGYFGRKIVLGDMTPITLTLLTVLIVSLFLLIVFRPHPQKMWHIFKAHFWQSIILGLSGTVFGTTLMYVALAHLDLGITTILEKLQPIFTLFLAAYFLKEKLPRRVLPYCFLALFSFWFISFDQSSYTASFKSINAVGLLSVIGAAFFWALSTIVGRALMRAGHAASDITLLRFVVGSVFMLPVFLMQPADALDLSFSPLVWSIVIGTSVFSTGCGYLLYYTGLKYVEAPTANFLELITPITSIGLGIVFLGETLSLIQIIFISFMLFSIYKISTIKKITRVRNLL